jgi:hypothetical protein
MADAAGLRAGAPDVFEGGRFEAVEGVGVSGDASSDDQHSCSFMGRLGLPCRAKTREGRHGTQRPLTGRKPPCYKRPHACGRSVLPVLLRRFAGIGVVGTRALRAFCGALADTAGALLFAFF